MANNYLQQAKGSNSRKTIGFETEYNSIAASTTGYALKFNPGDGVKASRELNSAETIQPGRSAVEPFQGNGSVEGNETFPNDVNQMYLLLKAAFGTPVTTNEGNGLWKHVFTIPEMQPSFTYEQLHKDIAERFIYSGCKISTLSFAAAADGQESTVTCGIMGSKPVKASAPVRISSITDNAGKPSFELSSELAGVSIDDYVVIAGCKSSSLNGVFKVIEASSSAVTVDAEYVAEDIVAGREPVCNSVHFSEPTEIPISRLGTFAATFYKDGEEYKCAKNVGIEIDMGLDGDQRVIGDNGYRSELPEGTVSVTTSLTALFKSGDLFREGSENATIALKLVFAGENGASLTIEIPQNKIQQTAPAIDTAAGLSQELTAIAFANSGSSVTFTLVNSYENM